MQKFILLFFIVCFMNIVGFSQQTTIDYKQHHLNLAGELQGVYQIQMVNSRMKPMITTDLLELIKEQQSETETISFFYRETIKIVIRSKQDVANGQLFADEEQIIYLNE